MAISRASTEVQDAQDAYNDLVNTGIEKELKAKGYDAQIEWSRPEGYVLTISKGGKTVRFFEVDHEDSDLGFKKSNFKRYYEDDADGKYTINGAILTTPKFSFEFAIDASEVIKGFNNFVTSMVVKAAGWEKDRTATEPTWIKKFSDKLGVIRLSGNNYLGFIAKDKESLAPHQPDLTTKSLMDAQKLLEQEMTKASLAEAEQYKTLNDASTYSPLLTPGPVEIWYVKKDFTRDFSGGSKGLKANDLLPKSKEDLGKTHALLGKVSGKDLEGLYMALQGEIWSPNGEARSLIKKLDLSHTSMSIGDIIVKDGKTLMVDFYGFTDIFAEHASNKSTQDIYVAWFELQEQYQLAYPYVALWKGKGGEDDIRDAKNFVKKEYGDKGQVVIRDAGEDIKVAKKAILKDISDSIKAKYPKTKIVSALSKVDDFNGLWVEFSSKFPKIAKKLAHDDSFWGGINSVSEIESQGQKFLFIDTPGHGWIVNFDGKIVGEEDGGFFDEKLNQNRAEIFKGEKQVIGTTVTSSVEQTVDQLLEDKKFPSLVNDMLEAADAGMQLGVIQKKPEMVEFNKLSKEFLKSLKDKKREEAISIGNELVKKGHGAAFGL